MDELEIKIEQTKKDYYNVTIVQENNKMFFAN